MSALDRKLLRDLWQMRGQALAICLVMACGVATFVMSLGLLGSLQRAQQDYYDSHRFAHVFAHLKRAPAALAERLAEVPGVARLETRIVEDVTLDLPMLPEPAIGRLISLPERGKPALNRLYLRRGRWLEPGRTQEVLASEPFADAHSLQPGDRIAAVINGRRQMLRIVGIVLSPEYVYQIRPGDVLPDARRFAVLWMNEPDLAAAFDLTGAFNDVSFRLAPGAGEEEVIRRVDRLTAPYGGLGAYGRAEQTSNEFVRIKIRQLRGMAMVAPMIFLAVAAFLLHIVLSRLINTQREQIATLKAFGYSGRQIGWHYLKIVLVLVLLGGVLGTSAGAWMGAGATRMHARFFHFPVLRYNLDSAVIAAGLLVSSGAAIAGTLGAVRKAMRLPPAQAMRPEPPANYRPTIVERLGLQALFSPVARMILRNLERQPYKALLSCLGLALAVAILVLGYFMGDSVQFAMETHFRLAQRQDLTVTFVEPTAARAIHDLAHLPGVLHCEPFRSVAVRLRHGPRSRRLGLMGLEPRADLSPLIDIYRRKVALPAEGLVLSRKLADLLDAAIGDTLVVEVLEGQRPVREAEVVNLVNDFSGTIAYMDRTALNKLMREDPVISGVYLAADPSRIDILYSRLKQAPSVSGVVVKEAAMDSFRETIAESLLLMRMFNIVFAWVIAFGVVYNSARIALSERSRELATLRVIGFTRGEVSRILLGELAVLTAAAIPLGLLLGRGFAALAAWGNDTELFRIPFVIEPATYGIATLVTLLAALASGLVVRGRIDHLDLVSVLKTKE
jgi:putative ABC transport system permease protein